ncbi:GNAT family N-acetyltransferase [Microbacterium mitrae]|nr:GNAT family N-acetyltransferase [Microbacterium mitrae]
MSDRGGVPLELRLVMPDDVKTVTRWSQDERVNRYVGGPSVWTVEFTRSRVLSAGGGDSFRRWYLASRGGDIVGMGAIMFPDESTELGYWVDPEHWGQGIAGQILDGMIAVAREADRGLPLSAQIQPANGASVRVAERAGFAWFASHDDFDEYRRES